MSRHLFRLPLNQLMTMRPLRIVRSSVHDDRFVFITVRDNDILWENIVDWVCTRDSTARSAPCAPASKLSTSARILTSARNAI